MSLHKKMKFSIKDFFSKCDQIYSFLRYWNINAYRKKIVSQEGQKQLVSEKILTENQDVAEVFNKFFINIVPNLKISTDHVHWWPSYECYQ